MRTKGRAWRWLAGIGGAAILLQTTGCNLSTQIGSIVSDAVFFLLDNALVHLTT
jgi:hypothetical protein